MQKIYIHIGTHKTGTTVFQHLIQERRFELARKENMYVINYHLYPDLRQLMEVREYDPLLVKSLRNFLESKIKDTSGKFLICSESLSGNPMEHYSNSDVVARILCEATKDYEVIIIVVLRRQDEFMQSMYMQKLHEGEAVNIEELISSNKINHLDWNEFLKPYLSCFGIKNVHVYPYDRAVLNNKTIVDILNMSLKSEVLANIKEVKKLNVGYSVHASAIAEKLNSQLNKRQNKILRSVLQETSNKGYLNEYNIISAEQKSAIIDLFEESNARLAKSYFKERFGISSFSKPIYKDYVKVTSIEKEYGLIVKKLLSIVENNESEINKYEETWILNIIRPIYMFFTKKIKRLFYKLD